LTVSDERFSAFAFAFIAWKSVEVELLTGAGTAVAATD
jgi:hypothetical protein